MTTAKRFPPLLWHYTSFKGLNGIVAESQLIASSLAYLNDTEEFLYAIKPLLAHFDKLGVTLADLGRGLFPESVPAMVKTIFEHHVRGQGIYVTCFSKEPDDLSQWRSYTPQPPGFAIGFQGDELAALANSNEFAMVDCKYPKPDDLRAEVIATYETATTGMQEEKSRLPTPLSSQARTEFVEKWAFKAVTAMIKLAPQRKHPMFAAEKEVRLLGNIALIGTKNRFKVEYRLSGSLMVPFMKLPARPDEGPSPIKAILIGPCPHQDAVIEVTRQMCIQHHVRAEVIPSDVPFRNW